MQASRQFTACLPSAQETHFLPHNRNLDLRIGEERFESGDFKYYIIFWNLNSLGDLWS